jgi:hypothetical protein
MVAWRSGLGAHEEEWWVPFIGGKWMVGGAMLRCEGYPGH